MATKGKGENFESSLARLETIVHKLEEGDLPLEGSLKVFEEGIKLVKQCEDRLNQAQRKIEILVKDQAGTKKAVLFEMEEE